MEITANDIVRLRHDHFVANKGNVPLEIEGKTIVGELTLQDDGRNLPAIMFTKCLFKMQVSVRQNSGYRELHFNQCVFEEIAQFEHLKSMLLLSGSHFKKDLMINGSVVPLLLKDFKVDQVLRLIGGYGEGIQLANVNVKTGTDTQNVGQLLLGQGHSGECGIMDCCFSVINFGKSWSFASTATFTRVTARSMNIGHITIGLWLVIKGSTLGDVQVDNLSKDHRYIQFAENCIVQKLSVALRMVDRLEITDCQIETGKLWGDIPKTSIVEIDNTIFTTLLFDKVFNEGRATYRGVKIPAGGKLAILSSALGKSDFIRCDFSKAILEFQNSKVSELFLSLTDFPKVVTCDDAISHGQAKLAFGQLRTAFEKQGDTVKAIEYQAREIEAHYDDLPYIKERKFPFVHFTKLALLLNKWSNDFGRDWGRGVVVSIVFGILCFYELVLSTKEYTLGWGIHIDTKLIASFFRFMNPLRFFDLEALFKQNGEQPYATLTTGSYFIDFIGRIGLAYGYYQTIQAFRRFGRK